MNINPDNHETRFGVLMTPEDHPLARLRRLLKRIIWADEETFVSERSTFEAEWDSLMPLLAPSELESLDLRLSFCSNLKQTHEDRIVDGFKLLGLDSESKRDEIARVREMFRDDTSEPEVQFLLTHNAGKE